jgi:hypothetical protein
MSDPIATANFYVSFKFMKINSCLLKGSILIALIPSFASAAEAEVRDIWYQPKAGGFLSSFDVGYRKSVLNLDSPGAPRCFASQLKGGAELDYGITDSFIIGADLSVYSTEQEIPQTATTKKNFSASGLADPTLLAGYRILHQNDSAPFLDAEFEFSPSLGKEKDTNVLRGNHLFGLGMFVGQQISQVEYKLGVELRYNTEKKDEINTYKARFDYAFTGAFQYDFNDFFSMNTQLELEFPGKLTAKNGSGSVSTQYNVEFSVGPTFQIAKNLSSTLLLSYGKSSGDNNSVDTDITAYAAVADLKFAF